MTTVANQKNILQKLQLLQVLMWVVGKTVNKDNNGA